jgi:hypothetical protein
METQVPKVGFLVIGAQKAGTTALDHYLRQHPQIGMAREKEVHFFDNEEAFQSGQAGRDQYERAFDFAPGRTIHGESTPIYLYWEPCAERIHRYNPEMKLIAILRHPMERAFSHWNMEFNRGAEQRDFLTALREEQELIVSGRQVQHRVRSYLHRGFYAEQIARYQRFFRPGQMLFLNHDRFRTEPRACLSRIFRFLGVNDGVFAFEPVELNRGHASLSIPPAEFDRYNALFHHDIRKLEALLGWDLSDWLSQRPPR